MDLKPGGEHQHRHQRRGQIADARIAPGKHRPRRPAGGLQQAEESQHADGAADQQEAVAPAEDLGEQAADDRSEAPGAEKQQGTGPRHPAEAAGSHEKAPHRQPQPEADGDADAGEGQGLVDRERRRRAGRGDQQAEHGGGPRQAHRDDIGGDHAEQPTERIAGQCEADGHLDQRMRADSVGGEARDERAARLDEADDRQDQPSAPAGLAVGLAEMVEAIGGKRLEGALDTAGEGVGDVDRADLVGQRGGVARLSPDGRDEPGGGAAERQERAVFRRRAVVAEAAACDRPAGGHEAGARQVEHLKPVDAQPDGGQQTGEDAGRDRHREQAHPHGPGDGVGGVDFDAPDDRLVDLDRHRDGAVEGAVRPAAALEQDGAVGVGDGDAVDFRIGLDDVVEIAVDLVEIGEGNAQPDGARHQLADGMADRGHHVVGGIAQAGPVEAGAGGEHEGGDRRNHQGKQDAERSRPQGRLPGTAGRARHQISPSICRKVSTLASISRRACLMVSSARGRAAVAGSAAAESSSGRSTCRASRRKRRASPVPATIAISSAATRQPIR